MSLRRLPLNWIRSRSPHRSGPETAAYRAWTPDGWDLCLVRLLPRDSASGEAPARTTPIRGGLSVVPVAGDTAISTVTDGPGGGRPVLLLPGYATDHRCFLPPVRGGVARALRDAGFDPWILEFRGTGGSRRRMPSAGPCRIDERIRFDVPAAIEAVRARTGAETVDVVGHSLGGVILYAHLALSSTSGVRRGATLASPGTFRPDRLGVGACKALPSKAMRLGRHGVKHMGRVPARGVVSWASLLPVAPLYQTHFERSTAAHPYMRRWLREMVTDIYGPELAQLAGWVTDGTLSCAAGRTNYQAFFPQIDNPMLFVAAMADRVVPLAGVEYAYEAISSPEKELLVLDAGRPAEPVYGHLDVLVGARAERDVFGPLVDWLAVVDGAQSAGRPLAAAPRTLRLDAV